MEITINKKTYCITPDPVIYSRGVVLVNGYICYWKVGNCEQTGLLYGTLVRNDDNSVMLFESEAEAIQYAIKIIQNSQEENN